MTTPYAGLSAGPSAYRPNVNRQKSTRWLQAQPVNYDGDEWGGDDDDDDDDGDDLPAPLPRARTFAGGAEAATGRPPMPAAQRRTSFQSEDLNAGPKGGFAPPQRSVTAGPQFWGTPGNQGSATRDRSISPSGGVLLGFMGKLGGRTQSPPPPPQQHSPQFQDMPGFRLPPTPEQLERAEKGKVYNTKGGRSSPALSSFQASRAPQPRYENQFPSQKSRDVETQSQIPPRPTVFQKFDRKELPPLPNFAAAMEQPQAYQHLPPTETLPQRSRGAGVAEADQMEGTEQTAMFFTDNEHRFFTSPVATTPPKPVSVAAPPPPTAFATSTIPVGTSEQSSSGGTYTIVEAIPSPSTSPPLPVPSVTSLAPSTPRVLSGRTESVRRKPSPLLSDPPVLLTASEQLKPTETEEQQPSIWTLGNVASRQSTEQFSPLSGPPVQLDYPQPPPLLLGRLVVAPSVATNNEDEKSAILKPEGPLSPNIVLVTPGLYTPPEPMATPKTAVFAPTEGSSPQSRLPSLVTSPSAPASPEKVNEQIDSPTLWDTPRISILAFGSPKRSGSEVEGSTQTDASITQQQKSEQAEEHQSRYSSQEPTMAENPQLHQNQKETSLTFYNQSSSSSTAPTPPPERVVTRQGVSAEATVPAGTMDLPEIDSESPTLQQPQTPIQQQSQAHTSYQSAAIQLDVSPTQRARPLGREYSSQSIDSAPSSQRRAISRERVRSEVQKIMRKEGSDVPLMPKPWHEGSMTSLTPERIATPPVSPVSPVRLNAAFNVEATVAQARDGIARGPHTLEESPLSPYFATPLQAPPPQQRRLRSNMIAEQEHLPGRQLSIEDLRNVSVPIATYAEEKQDESEYTFPRTREQQQQYYIMDIDQASTSEGSSEAPHSTTRGNTAADSSQNESATTDDDVHHAGSTEASIEYVNIASLHSETLPHSKSTDTHSSFYGTTIHSIAETRVIQEANIEEAPVPLRFGEQSAGPNVPQPGISSTEENIALQDPTTFHAQGSSAQTLKDAILMPSQSSQIAAEPITLPAVPVPQEAIPALSQELVVNDSNDNTSLSVPKHKGKGKEVMRDESAPDPSVPPPVPPKEPFPPSLTLTIPGKDGPANVTLPIKDKSPQAQSKAESLGHVIPVAMAKSPTTVRITSVKVSIPESKEILVAPQPNLYRDSIATPTPTVQDKEIIDLISATQGYLAMAARRSLINKGLLPENVVEGGEGQGKQSLVEPVNSGLQISTPLSPIASSADATPVKEEFSPKNEKLSTSEDKTTEVSGVDDAEEHHESEASVPMKAQVSLVTNNSEDPYNNAANHGRSDDGDQHKEPSSPISPISSPTPQPDQYTDYHRSQLQGIQIQQQEHAQQATSKVEAQQNSIMTSHMPNRAADFKVASDPKVRSLGDILQLPAAEERIKALEQARKSLQNNDTGLQAWVVYAQKMFPPTFLPGPSQRPMQNGEMPQQQPLRPYNEHRTQEDDQLKQEQQKPEQLAQQLQGLQHPSASQQSERGRTPGNQVNGNTAIEESEYNERASQSQQPLVQQQQQREYGDMRQPVENTSRTTTMTSLSFAPSVTNQTLQQYSQQQGYVGPSAQDDLSVPQQPLQGYSRPQTASQRDYSRQSEMLQREEVTQRQFYHQQSPQKPVQRNEADLAIPHQQAHAQPLQNPQQNEPHQQPQQYGQQLVREQGRPQASPEEQAQQGPIQNMQEFQRTGQQQLPQLPPQQQIWPQHLIRSPTMVQQQLREEREAIRNKSQWQSPAQSQGQWAPPQREWQQQSQHRQGQFQSPQQQQVAQDQSTAGGRWGSQDQGRRQQMAQQSANFNTASQPSAPPGQLGVQAQLPGKQTGTQIIHLSNIPQKEKEKEKVKYGFAAIFQKFNRQRNKDAKKSQQSSAVPVPPSQNPSQPSQFDPQFGRPYGQPSEENSAQQGYRTQHPQLSINQSKQQNLYPDTPVSPHPGNLITYGEHYNSIRRNESIAGSSQMSDSSTSGYGASQQASRNRMDDSSQPSPKPSVEQPASPASLNQNQFEYGQQQRHPPTSSSRDQSIRHSYYRSGVGGYNQNQIPEEDEYDQEDFKKVVGEKPVLPPIASMTPIEFRTRSESRAESRTGSSSGHRDLRLESENVASGSETAAQSQSRSDPHPHVQVEGLYQPQGQPTEYGGQFSVQTQQLQQEPSTSQHVKPYQSSVQGHHRRESEASSLQYPSPQGASQQPRIYERVFSISPSPPLQSGSPAPPEAGHLSNVLHQVSVQAPAQQIQQYGTTIQQRPTSHRRDSSMDNTASRYNQRPYDPTLPHTRYRQSPAPQEPEQQKVMGQEPQQREFATQGFVHPMIQNIQQQSLDARPLSDLQGSAPRQEAESQYRLAQSQIAMQSQQLRENYEKYGAPADARSQYQLYNLSVQQPQPLQQFAPPGPVGTDSNIRQEQDTMVNPIRQNPTSGSQAILPQIQQAVPGKHVHSRSSSISAESQTKKSDTGRASMFSGSTLGTSVNQYPLYRQQTQQPSQIGILGTGDVPGGVPSTPDSATSNSPSKPYSGGGVGEAYGGNQPIAGSAPAGGKRSSSSMLNMRKEKKEGGSSGFGVFGGLGKKMFSIQDGRAMGKTDRPKKAQAEIQHQIDPAQPARFMGPPQGPLASQHGGMQAPSTGDAAQGVQASHQQRSRHPAGPRPLQSPTGKPPPKIYDVHSGEYLTYEEFAERQGRGPSSGSIPPIPYVPSSMQQASQQQIQPTPRMQTQSGSALSRQEQQTSPETGQFVNQDIIQSHSQSQAAAPQQAQGQHASLGIMPLEAPFSQVAAMEPQTLSQQQQQGYNAPVGRTLQETYTSAQPPIVGQGLRHQHQQAESVREGSTNLPPRTVSPQISEPDTLESQRKFGSISSQAGSAVIGQGPDVSIKGTSIQSVTPRTHSLSSSIIPRGVAAAAAAAPQHSTLSLTGPSNSTNKEDIKITPPPSPPTTRSYPVVVAGSSSASNPNMSNSDNDNASSPPKAVPVIDPQHEFSDEKIVLVDDGKEGDGNKKADDDEEEPVMTATAYPGQAWEPEYFWMNPEG